MHTEKREKLNSIFGMPMMAVESFEEGGDQVKQIKEKMQLPEDADLFQVFSQMPKEQLLKMMDAMTSNMKDMPDSIVTQAAVQYVQQEYEGQGIDVDGCRSYIPDVGLKCWGWHLSSC